MWWVPVVISAACIAVGAGAAARWLPDLEPGPIGGLAFLAVCGLLAGALDLVGLHIYTIATELDGVRGLDTADFVASSLENMLRDSGTLVGLAGIIFLLAPRQAKPGFAQPSAEPD